MTFSEKFCAFVRSQVKDLNLSAFARKAGVARPAIWAIKHGEIRRIYIDFAWKVSEALGYKLSDVIRKLETDMFPDETFSSNSVEVSLSREIWERIRVHPDFIQDVQTVLVRDQEGV